MTELAPILDAILERLPALGPWIIKLATFVGFARLVIKPIGNWLKDLITRAANNAIASSDTLDDHWIENHAQLAGLPFLRFPARPLCQRQASTPRRSLHQKHSMKTIIQKGRDAFHRVRIILPICAFVALWLPGCATAPPAEDEVARLHRVATVAEIAAYTGAGYWLLEHPNDREKITIAVAALDALSSTNGFSAAALHKALLTLPISELKSDKGALLVGGAVLLYEAELNRLTPIHQGPYVAVVTGRVRAGLQRALDQTK